MASSCLEPPLRPGLSETHSSYVLAPRSSTIVHPHLPFPEKRLLCVQIRSTLGWFRRSLGNRSGYECTWGWGSHGDHWKCRCCRHWEWNQVKLCPSSSCVPDLALWHLDSWTVSSLLGALKSHNPLLVQGGLHWTHFLCSPFHVSPLLYCCCLRSPRSVWTTSDTILFLPPMSLQDLCNHDLLHLLPSHGLSIL